MNSVSQKTINYILLKKDEQNVMSLFKNTFQQILDFFQNQINIVELGSNKSDLDNLFENALKIEKSIVVNIKDIQDECIWLIQKHEPRASHLRFLISIINSLNDLKRISDYIVSFSKFFNKYYSKISLNLKKIIIDICYLCLDKTKEFLALLNQEENNNSYSDIFNIFLTEYKKLYLNFINQITIEDIDNDIAANGIILIKNIDRTIDHCVNIIENFANINN